jgi:hypothetical protein
MEDHLSADGGWNSCAFLASSFRWVESAILIFQDYGIGREAVESTGSEKQNMAIEYVLKAEGDLLTVKTSGFDENLKEVEEYGLAILEACTAGHYSRVLCDETELEYRLSTFDTFQSAEFLASQAPRIGKAAIVCNARFIGEARFWETVAVNRGLTVRVFKDVQSARNWLESP